MSRNGAAVKPHDAFHQFLGRRENPPQRPTSSKVDFRSFVRCKTRIPLQQQTKPGAGQPVAENDQTIPPKPLAADVMPSLEEALRMAELKAAEHHDAWLRAKADSENASAVGPRRKSPKASSLPPKSSPAMLPVKDSLEAALATGDNASLESSERWAHPQATPGFGIRRHPERTPGEVRPEQASGVSGRKGTAGQPRRHGAAKGYLLRRVRHPPW